MINLNQILNNNTWHVLKRDFVVVINTFSTNRKEAVTAKKEIVTRIAKYKHRDSLFINSYPSSRISSYIDIVIGEDDKEYFAIILKLKLNMATEVKL